MLESEGWMAQERWRSRVRGIHTWAMGCHAFGRKVSCLNEARVAGGHGRV